MNQENWNQNHDQNHCSYAEPDIPPIPCIMGMKMAHGLVKYVCALGPQKYAHKIQIVDSTLQVADEEFIYVFCHKLKTFIRVTYSDMLIFDGFSDQIKKTQFGLCD